jgi:hypothetical protein
MAGTQRSFDSGQAHTNRSQATFELVDSVRDIALWNRTPFGCVAAGLLSRKNRP